MSDETEPCTDAETLHLYRVAVMRTLLGHLAGCQCKTCDSARAVWHGQLDELDRLAATVSRRDCERLMPEVLPMPSGEEWDAAVAVMAFLRSLGGQ